ncbi:MAG: RtcB family protein [Methanoculleus bourgensis]|jgi:tRNA-splicing ligase RtcB|uniref:RtcB family protein n=1 Tax=Methanoculleus bourgensis TaxID=83986 RepID=UPI0017A4B632|nr:RtcB family protein [Methanoculleus bourgensis]MDD3372970.1 RtcB family protein [Methanoculleus bourgensis]NMA89446.1 RtcB family protein [Methanoculleus bourgensis]
MLEGINKIGDLEWEVPVGYVPDMRVPGRFFLSRALAETLEEGAVRQLANVATLPGIVKHSLAMPDIHWGYGFPIGGVAAFDRTEGVISPGGVGFDINCGVRLITTPLTEADLAGKKRELIEALFSVVPTGVGARSAMRVSNKELTDIMVNGARWTVERGLGTPEDLARCEEEGAMPGADPDSVSAKARQRGMPQIGTLGAGNHFLEIQVAREIVDPEAARIFGIAEGQICFMVHCGSRGLGHQVATDHLRILENALGKYQIRLPDRQLACAPIDSPEGRAYYGGMACAANYAWANRQVIMHEARKVFVQVFGIDYDEMKLIYDVAHNVAKFEHHDLDGTLMEVCVHRKGATRAFGPRAPGIPREYAAVGQPVLIPGSMGTSSYLLHGTATAMQKTWGSTCHGAGRVLSRSKAKKEIRGRELREQLAQEGILVRAHRDSVLAEEAPEVYKPSHEVVRVVHEAGLSGIVARLEPLGVIKG